MRSPPSVYVKVKVISTVLVVPSIIAAGYNSHPRSVIVTTPNSFKVGESPPKFLISAFENAHPTEYEVGVVEENEPTSVM